MDRHGTARHGTDGTARHVRDRAPVGPGDVAGGPAMAVTELLWAQGMLPGAPPAPVGPGDVGWGPACGVTERRSG
eukprot:gene21231-biopygen7110